MLYKMDNENRVIRRKQLTFNEEMKIYINAHEDIINIFEPELLKKYIFSYEEKEEYYWNILANDINLYVIKEFNKNNRANTNEQKMKLFVYLYELFILTYEPILSEKYALTNKERTRYDLLIFCIRYDIQIIKYQHALKYYPLQSFSNKF